MYGQNDDFYECKRKVSSRILERNLIKGIRKTDSANFIDLSGNPVKSVTPLPALLLVQFAFA